jgi:hypothetical protein
MDKSQTKVKSYTWLRIWNQWSSIATMVYKCNVLRIFPCISLMRGLIGLSGSPSVNMFGTFSVWDINFLEEQGADKYKVDR